MKKIFFILILIIFNSIGIVAQTNRDQDLITLNNGYQYLGYIIEQVPGNHIKLYRPIKNDTIIIKLGEIEVMNKISVVGINKQKLPIDSIGKYNTRKNVNQFSYMAASNFWEYYFLQGLSYTYSRNFKNRYYIGVSTSFLGDFKNRVDNGVYGATNDTGQTYYSYDDGNYKFIVSTMIENKFRFMSWRTQQRKISLLAGVNAGYVMDFSRTSGYVRDDNTKAFLYNYEEKYKGNFALGVSLALKINPDNNSGIMIEPGVMFYNPTIYTSKEYPNTVLYSGYNGSTTADSFMFSTKLSYFF